MTGELGVGLASGMTSSITTIEMKAVHTSVATAARMMYSEIPVDEFDAARMAVKDAHSVRAA